MDTNQSPVAQSRTPSGLGMAMTEQDTDLIAVRIQVAEMHGMLTQALGDHGQRIANLEDGQAILHGRITTKRALISQQGEQIIGLQKAVNKLEVARVSMLGRVGIVLASCTGVGGMILAVWNAIRITQ